MVVLQVPVLSSGAEGYLYRQVGFLLCYGIFIPLILTTVRKSQILVSVS